MDLQRATDTAAAEASKAGTSFVVWRMPAWPVGCYACDAKWKLLPMEAIIAAECPPPTVASRAPQASLF